MTLEAKLNKLIELGRKPRGHEINNPNYKVLSECSGIDRKLISACIRGVNKTAGGFIRCKAIYPTIDKSNDQ